MQYRGDYCWALIILCCLQHADGHVFLENQIKPQSWLLLALGCFFFVVVVGFFFLNLHSLSLPLGSL